MTTHSYRLTDSEAINKLLLLIERDEWSIVDASATTIEGKHTLTGTTAFFGQNGLAATLTETQYFGEQAVELEITAPRVSLGAMSELLGLNPHYQSFYELLSFSDVKLYASASEAHDNEYLTLEGTVLSADENKWHFLGIDVKNPLPLKELKLAATLGSCRMCPKRRRAGRLRKSV